MKGGGKWGERGGKWGLGTLKFMNKNKNLSGGGKILTGGGKWGERGREVG